MIFLNSRKKNLKNISHCTAMGLLIVASIISFVTSILHFVATGKYQDRQIKSTQILKKLNDVSK